MKIRIHPTYTHTCIYIYVITNNIILHLPETKKHEQQKKKEEKKDDVVD